MSHSNLNKLYHDANVQVNHLYQWFCSNRLSLNSNKTKYILLRPKHMREILSSYSIQIGNTILDRIGNDCKEQSTKFLGMHIDENLTWKQHIAAVKRKVSSALFFIRQVKHVLPPDSLRTLYFALIHPHLTYGITVWGNADQNVIRPLMLVQKRAIRIINNASYFSHTGPKFKKSGILKLHDLFVYQSLLFVHDYLSNKLPNSFNGCFPTNRDMPSSRTTRQSSLLHVPKYPLKFSQRQPIGFLPSLWNKWTKLIPEKVSRSQAKKIIKTTLLQDYPDVVRCENTRCYECHFNVNRIQSASVV